MAPIFETDDIEDEVDAVVPTNTEFCPCQYGMPGRCQHCDSRLAPNIYDTKEVQR